MNLTEKQLSIIESPLDSTVFLSGPAGTGKTTAGIQRLNYLAQQGIPGREILLLFPQRNLGADYQESIASLSFPSSSLPISATFGGLARRTLDLFWPVIRESYPQFEKGTSPTFLPLESALYFLSRIVEPLIIERGYFATLTVQRNRLYSQILDNLNKAAVHGFSHAEIKDRLNSSWIGDPSQEVIYDQAQSSASLFREYCYANNLLDYSLQVELFSKSLHDIPIITEYFHNQISYLIYDNVEEDIPVAHDFVYNLSANLHSSLLIFDQDAGYRSFLGASPENGSLLSRSCQTQVSFSETFTESKSLSELNIIIKKVLHKDRLTATDQTNNLSKVLTINFQPYYPQMVSWIAKDIKKLIQSGTPPGEIVILAPYLSDSLRYLLTTELEKNGIRSVSHRPSRSLRDESVTHCLLTLSSIAHPEWHFVPSVHELAFAFLQSIKGLDLTRAYLLSKQVLKSSKSPPELTAFEDIPPAYQERITFFVGKRFQEIADWVENYTKETTIPLDHFLIRLFGEVLSQNGFGFHNDFAKAQIADQMTSSVKKFRQTAGEVLSFTNSELGAEYYRMVKTGVLANQYLPSWTKEPIDAVLLAPAYTFLLKNKPVDYQFWLDVGSRGWYERIYQPLTNPHVLSRNWKVGEPWRDTEELNLNLKNLTCLSTGLIRRCRIGIICCLTETDERGFEQKGLLLQALNTITKTYPRPVARGLD